MDILTAWRWVYDSHSLFDCNTSPLFWNAPQDCCLLAELHTLLLQIGSLTFHHHAALRCETLLQPSSLIILLWESDPRKDRQSLTLSKYIVIVRRCYFLLLYCG